MCGPPDGTRSRALHPIQMVPPGEKVHRHACRCLSEPDHGSLVRTTEAFPLVGAGRRMRHARRGRRAAVMRLHWPSPPWPCRPAPSRRDATPTHDGLPNTWERSRSLTSPSAPTRTATASRTARRPRPRRADQPAGVPDRDEPASADTRRRRDPDWREDPDHDGLDNEYEYLAGTNPRKKDTDGDGISDGREDPDKDGLTNSLRADARRRIPKVADTDGDGYRDGTELRAGTNPKDAAEPPERRHRRDPGGVARPCAGAPGLSRSSRPTTSGTRGSTTATSASNSATMIIDDRPRAAACTWTSGRTPATASRINVVGNTTPAVKVTFDYDDESDHVLYPIPASPKVEGGSDRHILMVDKDLCRLYELFDAAQGQRRLARGQRRDVGPALERAPPRGLDQRRRGRPADPARPRPLRRGRPPAPSPTPCGSRRTAPGPRTSTRRATRPANRRPSSLPPMGLRVRLKAPTTRPASRRRPGSSRSRSSATG